MPVNGKIYPQLCLTTEYLFLQKTTLFLDWIGSRVQKQRAPRHSISREQRFNQRADIRIRFHVEKRVYKTYAENTQIRHRSTEGHYSTRVRKKHNLHKYSTVTVQCPKNSLRPLTHDDFLEVMLSRVS